MSTDETKDIINSYKDDRIRYFLSDKHTSLGEARNLAIAHAEAPFIAFIDADDIWLEQKLSEQLQSFDNPEVGLVYSNTIIFNNGGFESTIETNSIDGYITTQQLALNYRISLESAIVRREKLEQLQYAFDTRLSAIEEYDLFLRLSKICKIKHLPKFHSKWRVHDKSNSASKV